MWKSWLLENVSCKNQEFKECLMWKSWLLKIGSCKNNEFERMVHVKIMNLKEWFM